MGGEELKDKLNSQIVTLANKVIEVRSQILQTADKTMNSFADQERAYEGTVGDAFGNASARENDIKTAADATGKQKASYDVTKYDMDELADLLNRKFNLMVTKEIKYGLRVMGGAYMRLANNVTAQTQKVYTKFDPTAGTTIIEEKND